jgi:hypothetical protein
MPTAAEPVDFLAPLRPLARELALDLIRQELAALGLNGAGPSNGAGDRWHRLGLGRAPWPGNATPPR